MKHYLLYFAVVLVSFSGWTQNKSANKEETEIAARVESLRQALIDADANKLKDLTSGDLSYGHSSGVVQNQSIFIEKLINGESDFVSIEFQNQTIKIIGDVTIVRHNLAAHTKDSGMDKDIKIGNMLVWQKQKSKWVLIARQAFKLPPTENK